MGVYLADRVVLERDGDYERAVLYPDCQSAGASLEFVEHVDGYESRGVGDWMHEDYTRGHFRLCMVGLGKDRCIQHSYPEIHKRQYGNGQSQAW